MNKKELLDLIEFSIKSKSPENKKIEFGIISENESLILKEKTGLNLLGFKRVIDKFGINHTLKNHGNKIKEEKRGQIAITKEDFLLIEKIVKTDNIIYSGKSKTGNDSILYEYIENNLFFYVEEIRTGRKELCIKTLYKRKPTIKK